MLKIGFIGAGTVATTLAIALSNKGYPVVAISSLNRESARKLTNRISGCRAYDDNQEVADKAEFVFIITPDDIIASVAAEIKWQPGQNVVHCSGADSTDILEPARKAGARVGVFHPLQTFASQKQENLPGITFAIEADESLLTTLKEMAAALGGHWIEIKADDKVIYHAAAVFACNYLITLVKMATDLWQSFDIPPEKSTRALLPLLRGTINNIDTVGIPRCLTGPIARGDAGTIRKHLNALHRVSPDFVASYRELGLQTITIALAKGSIDNKQADELEAILSN